jgi:hypothetical protein
MKVVDRLDIVTSDEVSSALYCPKGMLLVENIYDLLPYVFGPQDAGCVSVLHSKRKQYSRATASILLCLGAVVSPIILVVTLTAKYILSRLVANILDVLEM